MTPDREHELAEEFNRARLGHGVSFALEGLRHLVIINGGALVGLFTFIGNIGGKEPAGVQIDPGAIWGASVAFIAGLALAVAANIAAYLSQDLFFAADNDELVSRIDRARGHATAPPSKGHERAGDISRAFGIACAGLSLLGFIVGALFALAGVLR